MNDGDMSGESTVHIVDYSEGNRITTVSNSTAQSGNRSSSTGLFFNVEGQIRSVSDGTHSDCANPVYDPAETPSGFGKRRYEYLLSFVHSQGCLLSRETIFSDANGDREKQSLFSCPRARFANILC